MKQTRKTFLLALTVLLVVVSSAFAFSPNIVKEAEFVEGEVLVVMKSPALANVAKNSASAVAQICASEASSLAAEAGATAVQTYNALSANSSQVLAHLRSKTKTADALIAELKDNPRVISVSKNYISKMAAVPNDARWSEQWGPKKINAPTAWDTKTDASDVVVAVLDTGVIYDHPDLAANMWKDGSGNYGKMFHDNGSSAYITGAGGGTSGATLTDWARVGDIGGHGTHVAGIIGAVGNNGTGVTGVNWKVKILTVGVFSLEADLSGSNISAYDTDIIAGLNYITALKNNGVNIRVANMSIGGYYSPMAETSVYGTAIKRASEAGIVICMAAGNENYNLDVIEFEDGTPARNYPSSFKFANTLSIGASTNADARAPYSNGSPSGQWVDVFAPGSDILSTTRSSALAAYPAGEQKYDPSGYISISGTSMATPMVAGAAALLCAAHPSETATQIKARLTSTATSVCRDASKYGQIDLGAAIQVPVTSITLNPTSAMLAPGATVQITATVAPTNATNKNINWSTSNAAIATVNTSGLVTGVADGSAVITATAADGSGVKAKCAVTVSGGGGGGGGGGGCAAGFGVLALLALVPFLRRKK